MPEFIEKIKKSFNYDDDYDFEPDDDLELEDYSDDISTSTPSRTSKYDHTLDLDDEYEDEYYEERSSKKFFKPKKQTSNVVPMKKTSNSDMEVVMLKPATINDAKEIADVLLTGRAVVINIEGVNLEMAQRIIDFVSGACYSMNGNLCSISKFIFIVTPHNIELSGEFTSTFIGGTNSVNVNM